MTEPERPALPGFVTWPIFPFEGDLRVNELLPDMATDIPREGEAGRPALAPKAGPLAFLETREHLDLEDFDDRPAGDLGRIMRRIDRAVTASGGVGRVHAHRWGDGASHFPMWFFGRPIGSLQLMGFGRSMWAETLRPMDEWAARMAAIGARLASTA